MNYYFPDYSEPSLKSIILFELNSLIGRLLFRRKSKFKIDKKPVLIDLGAGQNKTDGWIHVDFFRNRFRKFWKKKSNTLKPEVETDLRFPLKCNSNVVDGVYSSHTLEHFYPNQAHFLLSEIYRVLKPGAWLRLIVPDLEIAVQYYNGEKKVEEWNYKYKAEAIANITQNWGHHSVWDEEILGAALLSKGYINIKKVEFGKEGTDSRLIKEEDVREFESLVVEAQKPFE